MAEVKRNLVVIFLLCAWSFCIEGQPQTFVLTPSYFNVAEGKVIQATATCGEGFTSPGERYCKLTGNTADVIRPGEQEIIQGQYCDYCSPENPAKAHPIQHAIDGTEKWWQSPPLSRGIQYNEVNITIDLGQLYHIAYIIIKSANSPRPGMWVLERSRDYGETYEAWQYFAESESDCRNSFGMESITEIHNDDDIICTADYSDIVPLEDGEIVVSLVNGRPGANNFSYSETLQEWTKATNIRLRLKRTNTLLGHLMGLARQDPTVTRRYYYSIKDISVGGRCVCNGHADTCDTPGPDGRLICTCSHNTCGTECEYCCPGFVQKKWKPATLESSNECEPCNCHGHSAECYYDEEVARNRLSLDIQGRYDGGGVCVDCQHNTAGINCELCEDGYFRQGDLPLDSQYVCQPCMCNTYFSTGNCAPITGQCECRPQFTGPDCERCNEGYYDFPSCKPCECNVNGTRDKICQANGGQCPCKPNYSGIHCDQCERGYYNFPECSDCDCDRRGSRSGTCDVDTGQCRCRDFYQGRRCDECQEGYYGYPRCDECACSPDGVTDDVCDKSTGTCLCKDNFAGSYCDRCATGYFGYPNCNECGCDTRGSQYEGCSENGLCYCQTGFSGAKCDRCADGYYRYPDCLACDCSRSGSRSIVCDEQNGQCTCRDGYQGRTCDMCAEGFYNYPNCEECNCNPAGVVERSGRPTGRCGQTQGACTCKANVVGRACDSCAPLYFNLARSNPDGCEACNCFVAGTVSGLAHCDQVSGQCLCKPAVDGRRCEECKDGYYRLEAGNAFGCVECGCDVGGSISNVCDKNTGQCLCRPRVTGRACSEPAQLHFFPSLHQIRFEIESGFTPNGRRPRIGYDYKVFPDFSYLGYAVMSSIQPIVQVSVNVDRPSIYRVVLRYLYDGSSPETGRITITPSSESQGSEQSSDILFIPGADPQFVTVEGGGIIMPFVLNPGEWTISIEAPDGALLDYLVLLPSAFYEGTVLIQSVADPCIPTEEQERCNYYVYPSYDRYTSVRGTDGYVYSVETGTFIRIRPFPDEYIRDQLEVLDLGQLDEDQDNIHWTMEIDPPGDYVFIIEYYGGGPGQQRATFDVVDGENTMQGIAYFYNCSYLCRTVVVSSEGEIRTFSIETDTVSLVLTQVDGPFYLAVSAVVAIPVSDFRYDFIIPALECVRTASGECVGSRHPIPPGSTTIDFFDPTGEAPKPPNMLIPTTTVRYITTPDGPTVYVEINLPPPGKYVFVVHYYQPNNSGFDVDFRILGEFDGEGSFNAGYCPHVSGCRVVVTLPDGSNEFDLTGLGQSIHLSIPDDGDHNLWVDYILAIPADQFTDDVLIEIPLDRAGEFITYCGDNEFFISSDSPAICQDATFSITTDFNNGALPCDCDPAGSRSFTCDSVGGQCSCRANIVGRQCDRCAVGYYDFPACRPCRCPNGVCNEETGECVCPQNVEGRGCDRCAPDTYGYDPLAGCVDCECDERGTQGSGVCNPVDGQCGCKPNVGGRRCDQCLPGYYQYPLCLPCDCDPAGTLPQICDQTSAQCLCKDNVVGDQCNKCREGTFDLNEENSQGCISCFCFGVTDDCRSYSRHRELRPFTRDWQVTNLENPYIRYSGDLVNVYVDEHGKDPSLAIYWIAPSSFLGNKLDAYGGRLSFRVSNNPKEGRGDLGSPAKPIRRPDIVLGGNGITIMYSNLQQPEPSRSLAMDLRMIEENFQYSFSGRPVNREDFMMVLANIDQFEIRAQYFDQIVDASLSSIEWFDSTSKSGSGGKASSVERCRCPPEYTGLSCERCSSGHYRSNLGPYLRQCVPCQCNNHSNRCDEETGYCLDCQENTAGPQCQTCRTGYHGNALSSVPGDGCESCACPEARDDHNYAETCGVDSSNNFYCICLEGHTGRYCERCEEGYYGDPARPNNRCQPCDCSGNTDNSRPGAECDSLYGNCLKCLPETKGDHCEECADWYYGDALILQNCQECDCDKVGSESCDGSTGQCICKPNVEGRSCDRCAAKHYNFASGLGCTPCDCNRASLSPQCDMSTGECSCQPGVEGRKCDRCIEGFYQYSRRGCRECSCAANLRCDPETGDCLCPEGAIGPNCDQCEERYVLTRDGCLPCDDCIHLLLDILEEMSFAIGVNQTNITVGLEALERLKALNESLQEVKTNVSELMSYNEDIIEPELSDAGKKLDALKKLARRTLKQARKSHDKSDKLVNKTDDTLQRALDIEAKINASYQHIKDLAGNTSIAFNISGDIDELFERALAILEEIKGRNHSDTEDEADVELEAARELLDRVRGYNNASGDLIYHLNNVSKNLDDFADLMEELANLTAIAMNQTDLANELMSKNFTGELKALEDEAEELFETAMEEDEEGLDLVERARDLLDDALAALEVTGANASALTSAYDKLENKYGPLQNALNDSRDLVDRAIAHAANLTAQADLLESLLVSTKELAENALNAARAYSNIVAAIEEAEKAALAAKNASSLAEEAANGFGSQPEDSLKQSKKLLKKAGKAMKRLDSLEEDLAAASDLVDQAKEKLDIAEYDLSEIEKGMRAIPSSDSECEIVVCHPDDDTCKPGFSGDNCNVAAFSDQAAFARMQAMDASIRADAAAASVGAISGQLPYLEVLVETTIPEGIEETNDNTAEAAPYVSESRAILDEIPALAESLTDKHNIFVNISSNVLGNLDILREQIDHARTLAQGIQIAARLEGNSTLQLRSSKVADEPQSVNSVSMYFSTTQPDALLFFAGGPSASDEYIALEIVDRALNFKFNLGDEDVTIPLETDVADGLWHEVKAERTGKKGKLTVYSEGVQEIEVEGQSSGFNSLLHLSEDWGIFVGGVGEGFTVPASVSVNPFIGGLDRIFFNQEPLAIWNFEDATSVNQGIRRNATDLSEKPNSEDEGSVLFDGNGYVKVDNPKDFGKQFVVTFSFKTQSRNGLIFFCGKGTDYMAVEIKGGKVVLQISINGESDTLITQNRYADKQWTSVDLNRIRQRITITVTGADGRPEELSTELDTTAKMNSIRYLYFGGLVGISDDKYPFITRRGFHGCIKDITITRSIINLLDNRKSKGIYPDCVEKDVRLVSFPAPYGGYVKLEPINVFTSSEFLFSFRAYQPSGLLVYFSDDAHEDVYVVTLNNGTVEAVFGRDTSAISKVQSLKQMYHDGMWHTVNIIRESNRELVMRIDDDDETSVNFRIRSSVVTDGFFFIGGLPNGLSYNVEAVPDLLPFIGCISNVVIGPDVQNFAYRIADQSARFDSCPRVAEVVSEVPPLKGDVTPTQLPSVISTTPPAECTLGFGGTPPEDPLDRNAVFFGATNESRYEYESFHREFTVYDEVSFFLKTAAEYGVLYYVADEGQFDFAALYLEEGHLVYSFDYGAGAVLMKSSAPINDNQWHQIQTFRDGPDGQIIVDGDIVATGVLTGSSTYLTTHTPLYVGGLPSTLPINDIPTASRGSLIGCIRDFTIVPFPRELTGEFEVPACEGLREPGAFFGEYGGYLILDETFGVGMSMTMSFEIKPRKASGTIFSVQKTDMDFMSLEMRSGELFLTVENGGGEFVSVYSPPNGQYAFCNGQWHMIKVVKRENVAYLEVDGVRGNEGVGANPDQTVANTNDPLYFGGIPEGEIHDGIIEDESFGGCLRKIVINDVPKPFTNSKKYGDVDLRSCPGN